MEQSWLTVPELADTYRVHETLIVRLIEKGQLEGYRIGRRQWRIPRAGWESYLEKQRGGPKDGRDTVTADRDR